MKERFFRSCKKKQNFKFLSEEEGKDHFSPRFQSYFPMIISSIRSTNRVKFHGMVTKMVETDLASIRSKKGEREKRAANFVVVAKCFLFERKLSLDERIGGFV